MNPYSPDILKHGSTFTKSPSQNTGNYLHQNRVFYKKYINEVNDALQSLITAGRIKRMELMSINNRALFNRGKVQRCQWTTKKYIPFGETFLPDVENINLDNRSPAQKRKSSRRHQTEQKIPQISADQKMLDILIEKQINRIKEQGLLTLGHKQEDIVKQACRSIEQQILQTQQKHKATAPAVSLKTSKTHHYRYILARKDHRRSVTQSAYSQQLQQVEKKNNAFLKLKQLDKKSFLRRIKQFPVNK